ncbi:protein PNS1-like [Triticum dicoccoides]|uniref:protein PNS1-like n=1 Tax=Triticum dicoccoides TaxID=85692 RepID=UPI000E7BA888|nr:protein PNS1-like [Triticum dicoccoides]
MAARQGGTGVGVGEITAAGSGITTGGGAAHTPADSPYQVPLEIEEEIYSPVYGNIAVPDSRGCCSGFTASVTKILFIMHLVAFVAFTIFLGVQASSHPNPTYKPFAHFIPLASSVILSIIAACFWTILAVTNPAKAIKTSLWTAPVSALGCDVVILLVGDGEALGIGVLIVVIAIAAALYSCWATGPRLQHAAAVLSTSVNGAHLPFSASCLVLFVVLAAFGYMAFWTVAISCISAAEGHFMDFHIVYVAALLVSISWTMQVLRYFVYVAVARLAHAALAYGVRMPGGAVEAFCGTMSGPAFGDICMGAVLVPVIAAVRSFARAINALSGSNDEFLFSCCQGCCLSVSEKLMGRVNRWGFVHVGARGKAFCVASRDVWSLFVLRGMAKLVDSDLTGSFCFLSAVTGGALASLVAGSWALAMDRDRKELALPISFYSFLIGYYMCRMMIAWPQACVAAYHVAYAENPQNPHLGTLIPDHLRELQALAAD